MRRTTIRLPTPTEYQREAFFCPHRYVGIEASTKAGKTVGAIIWQASQVLTDTMQREHWWIAPVYSQAEIAFRRVKRMLPREIIKTNENDLLVSCINGARWSFKSGEKPDNLYGEDVATAVIDEASRIREDSWVAVRSTLTATRGPIRAIGNVKGRRNWFYRLCRDAERGAQDMHFARITAHDAVAAGILSAAEIEDAKRRLPAAVFRELYEAQPSDDEGRVYRSYAPDNIRSDIGDLGGPVLVGMDFNVDPMSAVVCAKAGDELHAFDEIVIRNGNTIEMAQEIRRRYPGRDVAVYPDPSGSARKTSAPVGQTDFTILRDHGLRVIAPKSAPPVVDRVNEVNAMLQSADGRRRLFVHPRCEALIEGFEMLTYKPGTSLPDKSLGVDHILDAIGYLVHAEFPIVKPPVARAGRQIVQGMV